MLQFTGSSKAANAAGKYTQKEKAVQMGIGTAFNIFEITYFLFKKSFTCSGAIIASTKV
jgi:hypothetical protein